ncbi:MAG: hypothetical protein AW12_01276 [Candidatus Accumulibacter sp. BA-94]|nr:MAG: hypothetical protein AW12_01276 [Candidatus Accumulibacter sp. BA-94]
MCALVELARLDVDGEFNLAAAGGGETVTQDVEAGGDESEEVAWLGEGIVPARPVAIRPLVAAGDRVAVGQQDRQAGPVGAQVDDVGRHDVRPVGEPGDAAEALCLALREVAVRRPVEPRQAAVVVGVDANACAEDQGVRRIGDGQCGFAAVVVGGGKRSAVDRQRDRLQTMTVELQWLRAGDRRVAPQMQPAVDEHLAAAKIDLELDEVYEKGGRGVILTTDSLRCWCVHGCCMSCR